VSGCNVCEHCTDSTTRMGCTACTACRVVAPLARWPMIRRADSILWARRTRGAVCYNLLRSIDLWRYSETRKSPSENRLSGLCRRGVFVLVVTPLVAGCRGYRFYFLGIPRAPRLPRIDKRGLRGKLTIEKGRGHNEHNANRNAPQTRGHKPEAPIVRVGRAATVVRILPVDPIQSTIRVMHG